MSLSPVFLFTPLAAGCWPDTTGCATADQDQCVDVKGTWIQSPHTGDWFFRDDRYGAFKGSSVAAPHDDGNPREPAKSIAFPHLGKAFIQKTKEGPLTQKYICSIMFGEYTVFGGNAWKECTLGGTHTLLQDKSPASGDPADKLSAGGKQDSLPTVQSGAAPTGAHVTKKGSQMASSLPTGRSHQTALVIDTRAGVSSAFQNRYNRLVESVNGANIKADIYTLRGNVAETGPGLVKGTPDQFVAPEGDEAEIDLVAWAAEQSYTLLLVAVDVKSAAQAA